MSLSRDREPVEVYMWEGRGYKWIEVRRYIIHRDGWLTCIDPRDNRERWVDESHWRKAKP